MAIHTTKINFFDAIGETVVIDKLTTISENCIFRVFFETFNSRFCNRVNHRPAMHSVIIFVVLITAKFRVPDKSKASPNRPQRFFDKSSSFCLVSKFHKNPKRTPTKPPKLHIQEGGQVSLAQILPSTECSTQVAV